jgi:hypothetical protein
MSHNLTWAGFNLLLTFWQNNHLVCSDCIQIVKGKTYSCRYEQVSKNTAAVVVSFYIHFKKFEKILSGNNRDIK